ncbi:SPOR domain-containing protein [Sandarakinorhabdus sp. AAP62]|uniref:SPOR domain-containing protein n=1 Tax=Sandarakinorhabdus sp. AAP62 TaxID=1248916 RepID=UPI0003188153|nr:SPOR domain-containing protein [Sandarakinorhabdus sp. AAP62]
MAGRDEDAPWLAEAAPLRAEPKKRPLLNIIIAVLALGAVAAVALLMLLGRRDGGSSQGYMEADQAPLIEADAGPYKVPPADRQGMDVQGDGEVIHEAVRGENPGAVIDMGALPEEPIGRPRDLLPPDGAAPPAGPQSAMPPAAAGQPVQVQVMPAGPPPAAVRTVPARPPVAAPAAAKPAAAPPVAVKPAPVVTKAAAAPAAKAATVQIGAFSSEAKAEEEWARVAGKGSLTGKRIEKLTSSTGKTLWRVRGTAADPDAACKAILAAKGACEVKK